MADSATIPTHLSVTDIDTCMTVSAVEDLRSADTSGPVAVDDSGRSAQTFLVEVVATRDGETRRAVASGQDIYAVTAPSSWRLPAACSPTRTGRPGWSPPVPSRTPAASSPRWCRGT